MLTIGRIIFAIPFLVFGALHFVKADMMAGMVPSMVPGGVIWVYLTGAAMIAAGIAFITKFKGKLAAQLLALLLLVFIITVHLPNASKNPMAGAQLLKDLSLLGACLMLAGIFGRQGQ